MLRPFHLTALPHTDPLIRPGTWGRRGGPTLRPHPLTHSLHYTSAGARARRLWRGTGALRPRPDSHCRLSGAEPSRHCVGCRPERASGEPAQLSSAQQSGALSTASLPSSLPGSHPSSVPFQAAVCWPVCGLPRAGSVHSAGAAWRCRPVRSGPGWPVASPPGPAQARALQTGDGAIKRRRSASRLQTYADALGRTAGIMSSRAAPSGPGAPTGSEHCTCGHR